MSGHRKNSEQKLNPDDVRNRMGIFVSGGGSSSNGGTNQDADDEAVQKLLMLGDLGIHRVEELPAEDEPRGNRDHDNRGRDHRGRDNRTRENWDHDSSRHDNPQIGADMVDSMANMWKRAQENGEFDDYDNEQVKDLSDLGGGRLYDRGRASTLKELDRLNGRVSERPRPLAPLDHPRYNVRPLQNGYIEQQQRARNSLSGSQQMAQPTLGSTLGAPATLGMGQPKGSKKRRNKCPSSSSNPTPRPPRVAVLNAREPNNTVFAVNTLFYPSSSHHGGVWGRAYLTNRNTTASRMLCIYTQGQQQATWLTSRLINVETYSRNGVGGVGLTFSTASGGEETTYLEFQPAETRDLFVRIIRALSDGTFSPALLSPTPSTRMPGTGGEMPRDNLAVSPQPVARAASPIHRPPIIRVHPPPKSIHSEATEADAFLRAAGLQPTSTTIPTAQRNAGASLPEQPLGTTEQTTTTPEVVEARPAKSESAQTAETLIDISNNDEDDAADITQSLPTQSSQLPDSDLGSLASLEAYYGIVHTFEAFLGRVGTGAPSSRASEEFLLGVGEAFVMFHSEQHPDLDAEVIRTTVRDAIANRMGCAESASDRSTISQAHLPDGQTVERAVDVDEQAAPDRGETQTPGDGNTEGGVRRSVVETLESRAPPTDAQQRGRGRRYAVEELMSMRHLATEPPHYLRDVKIPLRGPDLHHPHPQPSPETVEAQVKRTANDMAWVMAASPRAQHAQPTIREPLEEVQPVQSSVGHERCPRRDAAGLGSSVWAPSEAMDADVPMVLTSATEAQNNDVAELANPEYQPPRSYMADVAQLQRTTSAAGSNGVPAMPSQTIPDNDASEYTYMPATAEPPRPPQQLPTPSAVRPSAMALSEVYQTELSSRMERLAIISPPRGRAPATENPAQTQFDASLGTRPVSLQQEPASPASGSRQAMERSPQTPQGTRAVGVANAVNPTVARLRKGLAASRHAR